MVNAVQASGAVNQNETGNATNSANNITANASGASKTAFPQDSVTISDSAVQAQANAKATANQ